VETSRDLGHAKIWVSVYGTDEEQAESIEALRRATPWLRRQLGERLRLRHVPQLTIRPDDSIASGDRVLRILRDIEAESAAKDGS
jgi:ribosome-binding factor A